MKFIISLIEGRSASSVLYFLETDLLFVFWSQFSFISLQHIEDLTQEKFSLQRALETSRALAESLASENSTLTDSFNQQVCTCHACFQKAYVLTAWWISCENWNLNY